MPDDTQIAIMFSGGTDSCYAVWSQVSHYKTVRLVTFVRQGLRRHENIRSMVNRLKSVYPEVEITHDCIDFDEIYQAITPHGEKEAAQKQVLAQEIDPLWDIPTDTLEGQQTADSTKIALFMTNECLQCKIAMHLAAIRYCTVNEISNLCDGANHEQLDDGSQLEIVKTLARDIFGQFGINYFSPAMNISEEDRCRNLFEAGIIDDINHKKLEKNHQIPSSQIQCTVPAAVLWTVCTFPWLVYDASSCDEYINMCYNYYSYEMGNNIKMLGLNSLVNPN